MDYYDDILANISFFFIGDTSTPVLPVTQDSKSILTSSIGMVVLLRNHRND